MAAPAAYVVECESYQRQFAAVSHMQPAQLQALLESGSSVTLLDVRTSEERAVSVIPGALSPEDLPRAELLRRAAADDAGPLVIYCTVGYRSSLEARRIAADLPCVPAGGVHSMAGILPWAHEVGRLVDPDTQQPTRRIHLFGQKWAAMAPDGWEVSVFPARQQAANLVPVVVATVRDWSRGLLARVLPRAPSEPVAVVGSESSRVASQT